MYLFAYTSVLCKTIRSYVIIIDVYNNHCGEAIKMHVSTVLIRMSFCLMIISKFQIICLATKSIAYYIYENV